MEEQDWVSEIDRLRKVKTQISEEIQKLNEIVDQRQGQALEIRRNFWDEVTVNMSDYTEIAETAASISQQQSILGEQERAFRHAEQNLKKCLKLKQAPYFARVDFTEEGIEQEDQIYIGIGSLVDEDTHELLIYDWRAPISSLFYDYTPGPASYQTPGGVIKGNVSLKRQFIIKRGVLESMFDTGIQIGDEMLQMMLAKSAHDKMSSIVTTIQQEQNQIIRNEEYDILIVQGAAGSGKTSVALQRVAYLLYRFRQSLSSDNMVLFSPNSIFNDYVSNVLPELGEANMLQTTFQEHLDRGIGKAFVVEDNYDQLEYLLSNSESDPQYLTRINAIEWKTSREFMNIIDTYVDDLKRKGMLFRSFTVRDKVLIPSDRLITLFYRDYAEEPLIEVRVKKIKKWVLEELARLEERVRKNRFRKLIENPRYMGTDAEMKEESRRAAKKIFAPLKKQAENLEFIRVMRMYRRLFTSSFIPTQYKDVGDFTESELQSGCIPFEDATPYLYFKTKFEGLPVINRMKHVLIDEAQDYSPFQLEYIKKLFPRAKFTILGDLNQGIFHANVQSYEGIEGLFQESHVGVVRMTKSYRSTSEIVDFTRKILQHPEPVEAIGRHGSLPRIISTTNEGLAEKVLEGLNELMALGAESLAVICKNAEETAQAYQALKDGIDRSVHLITKDSMSFKIGIVVIPAYLAKGLEFDGVILYNASNEIYNREQERKLLYTACTRALHELYIYHTGELSPLIPSISKHK